MKKNYRKKKFNKKRKSTYKIFFLILVGMTVGFAAINTTLQLIGTLNISKTTWNIHWENPTKTGGVTATQDVHLKSGDDTTVEYQVKLTNPGDYYEFTVDAKNDGTIDGMITNISNKVYENNVEVNPTYLESTITYADGATIENNHLLAAGKKETYKVKVTYKTGLAADQLPDQEKTYNFRFTVTYMQADENAQKVRPDWTLPTGKTKDNLEVGDEICLYADPTQCFNFIRYDNEDIVMLAKYNLKVGNIYDSSFNKTGEYTSSDTGYGLQSSEARGYVDGASTYNGTVAFSDTNYWDDNGSPSSSYPGAYYPGPNYPTIYDPTNYKGEPGQNNYSVAYYVDAYKTLLTNNGVTIKNARLLTYAEATDVSIGCDASNWSCPTNGFITNTTFWLGSASSNSRVWYVYFDDNSDNNSFNVIFFSDDLVGVRPVIVISKSNI